MGKTTDIKCPTCKRMVPVEKQRVDWGRFIMPRHGKTVRMECEAGDKVFIVKGETK